MPLDDERHAERVPERAGSEHLADRSLCDGAPLAQQQRVGEAGRNLFDMVGDQHHGGRVGIRGEPSEASYEVLATAEVEAAGRFVEQHQLGVGHQGAGDLDPLALALAQRAEAAVGEVGDTQRGEQKLGTLHIRGVVGLLPAPDHGVGGGEHDVAYALPRRQPLGERGTGQTYAWAELEDVDLADPLLEQVHGAAGGMQLRGDHLKQRGLARAIGSEHDPTLVLLDHPVQVFQDGIAVAHDADAYALHDRCHVGDPTVAALAPCRTRAYAGGMPVLPAAARLAAWGGAVLRGDASIDEAVDQVAAGDLPELHAVRVLAAEDARGRRVDDGSDGDALVLTFGWLRRERVEGLRVVLSAPGDPGGVRGRPDAVAAAVHAGQAVVTYGGPLAYALVPEIAPLGSSGLRVRWSTFEVDQVRAGDQLSLGEADRALQAGLSAATAELLRLDVARWRPEVAEAIAGLRSSAPPAALPAGYSPRALRVLTSAQRIAAIVDLAAPDPGAAVSASEVRQRSMALDDLARTCRRAMVAAVNSVLEDSAERPDLTRGNTAPEWGYSTER